MKTRARLLVRAVPLLLAGVASLALAATREDFAWQWPLDTGGEDGLLALTLDPAVYEQALRDDLADVVAFNGAGEPVPLGPVAQPRQRAQALQPEPVPVPMFAVPRDAPGANAGDSVALHIARGTDGRLLRLDAEVSPGLADEAPGDLLLDLSAFERPVAALALQLAADSGAVNARVAVDGSDDLGSWRQVADGQAVVSLSEGGFRLQRTRLEFAPTGFDYLRIRRVDGHRPLPVAAVAAVPAPVEAGLLAPPVRELLLPGSPAEPDDDSRASRDGLAGVFDYEGAGPFPVAAVDVALADRNAIAEVVVSSRAGDDAPWTQRARFTAFQLAGNGAGVGNDAVSIGSVRDRHWRVRTTPAQARAPGLRLDWAPDRFLLLTQGEPPYILAAGSARATRPAYPLKVALAELQAQHGEGWQPPQARTGRGAPLAGDAALEPAPTPVPVRRYLLWVVLVGGAVVVVGMVLSLLRRAPAPD